VDLWSSYLMHLLVVMMHMMVMTVVLVLSTLHKEHGEAGYPCLFGLLDELFGSEHLFSD
jgi:hypothetical protein